MQRPHTTRSSLGIKNTMIHGSAAKRSLHLGYNVRMKLEWQKTYNNSHIAPYLTLYTLGRQTAWYILIAAGGDTVAGLEGGEGRRLECFVRAMKISEGKFIKSTCMNMPHTNHSCHAYISFITSYHGFFLNSIKSYAWRPWDSSIWLHQEYLRIPAYFIHHNWSPSP